MAELNARIIPKASGTAGEVPLASDLETAELAVNTADGTLFTKDVSGNVVTISGGGGGAVDSVNGETGVVSLGIQDMDDFELNADPTVSVYLDTLRTGLCYADGQFAEPVNNNGNIGDYFLYYGGGSDYVQFSKLTEGDSITFTFDDGSQHITTFVGTGPSGGGTEYYMTIATDLPAQALVTQTMDVASPAFGAYTPVPLVEGDLLQWNDADQKFKPVEYFNVKAASYSDLVGGQSVDSTTATVVTGCTNVVTENSIYSNTAGVITISEAGVYEIYGCVGATGDTANYRWTAEYDVRVDGSMVARQVGGYIRAANDSVYSDIAVNTIVPIAAGQTVDFTIKRVSNILGNATVLANTSRILIKKLS